MLGQNGLDALFLSLCGAVLACVCASSVGLAQSVTDIYNSVELGLHLGVKRHEVESFNVVGGRAKEHAGGMFVSCTLIPGRIDGALELLLAMSLMVTPRPSAAIDLLRPKIECSIRL